MWDAIGSFFEMLATPIKLSKTVFDLGKTGYNLIRAAFGNWVPEFLKPTFLVIIGLTLVFFILSIVRRVL